jgi:predicted DNA-binding transcriptional regulator AlpA
MNVIMVYPKDAAKILGLSVSSFYRISRRKGFPSPVFPNGKRPMFLIEDLEKWARSLK